MDFEVVNPKLRVKEAEIDELEAQIKKEAVLQEILKPSPQLFTDKKNTLSP